MVSRVKWDQQVPMLLFQSEDFVKRCREVENMESWKEIAEKVNKQFGTDDKTGKQCRERYVNYIRFNNKVDQLN